MKNKLKYLVALIFALMIGLLSIVKFPSNNKSFLNKKIEVKNILLDEVTKSSSLGISSKTGTSSKKCSTLKLSLSSSGLVIDTSYHGKGVFYEMNLGDKVALCLSAGKAAKSGNNYKYVRQETNTNKGKALVYAKSADTKGRLAAQVVVWTGNISEKEIAEAFKSAGYKQAAEFAKQEADNIRKAESSSYCVYEYLSGHQPVITLPGENGCGIVCEEDENKKCKNYEITTEGSLPVCSDDGTPKLATFMELSLQSGWTRSKSVEKSIYGYKTIDIEGSNGYCRLDCLEEVKIGLPGGYSEPFRVGSLDLVWPQSKENHAAAVYGNYKLFFKGRKKCHIVFNTTSHCDYEDWCDDSGNSEHPYYGPKKYVEAHKNDEHNDLAKGTKVSDTSTKNAKKNEQLRLTSYYNYGDVRGGMESNNIDSYEQYLKDEKFTDNDTMGGFRDAAEKDGKEKCLNGSHDETCDKKDKDCKDGTKSVTNDSTYCDSHFTEYGDGVYYNHWVDSIKKLQDTKDEYKKYMKQYWNAKEILVSLYICDTYNIDKKKEDIYKSLKTSLNIERKESDTSLYNFDTHISVKAKNVKCENCDRGTTNFKPIDQIKSLSDLIGANELKNNIKSMQEKENTLITEEKEVSLPNELPFNYSYLDVLTNELKTKKPENNYKKIEYRFIPISMDAKLGKTYDLVIKNIQFGNTRFNSNLHEQKYICHYTVTSAPNEENCNCRPETGHGDIKLTPTKGELCSELQDKEEQPGGRCTDSPTKRKCPTESATEEQNKAYRRCVNNKVYTEEKCALINCYDDIETCPLESKKAEYEACLTSIGGYNAENHIYCFNETCHCINCECPDEYDGKKTDYPGLIITGCTERYKEKYPSATDNQAAKYCIRKKCFKYECPKNTPKEYMDISSCVELYLKNTVGVGEKTFQIATLKQINEALKACQDSVCPYNGLKIIYRTIKLENPFPSYDADNTKINDKKIKQGTYNVDIIGRYPGSNWNSRLRVYNEIIDNRGRSLKFTKESQIDAIKSFEGTKIYQDRQPLYTFELTPKVINEIRKYNRSQNAKGKGSGYSDTETLNCKTSVANSTRKKSIACVSSFVHNIKYGLRSGECQNITDWKNFYACSESIN